MPTTRRPASSPSRRSRSSTGSSRSPRPTSSGPPPTHPQLSYAIGGHFDLAADLKQGLLEELSERVRLEAIHTILEGSHEAIATRREIAAKAQRNGKH